MPTSMREGLLREAFTILREHGRDERECVVYLAGPRTQPGVVDEVLHPIRHARPDFYEIDGIWLTATWLDLARRDREIRVQVHTHGREAFHSETDDRFPIVQTPGFLSLVIPWFATGPVSLDGTFLAALEDNGQWDELDPTEELVVA